MKYKNIYCIHILHLFLTKCLDIGYLKFLECIDLWCISRKPQEKCCNARTFDASFFSWSLATDSALPWSRWYPLGLVSFALPWLDISEPRSLIFYDIIIQNNHSSFLILRFWPFRLKQQLSLEIKEINVANCCWTYCTICPVMLG